MPLQPPDLSVPMRLDLTNACLWRGAQRIALRPKTLAVLQCLLAHPGQLVTKATLLDAVWPETTVNDVALMICIRELRQALGDNPKAPRFIETMHRRGYRFVGDLPVTAPPSCSLPAVVSSAIPPVGRQEELTRLHAWLASARRGMRQMIFVTGEAGLGKTTLVEAFVAAIGNHGPLWIGHGQCVEHYGAGEAYLPVLEALGRLCRGPDGKELVALLGQQAPTWLVQIPGLLRAADLETLRRRSAGTTRERMLRELAEALDLLTARQPLVLVLEDLHWSDPSTLDLLAVLARRREAARLLLIGTYRPPEVLRRTPHPLHTIKHELQLHGHCAELPLTLLTEDAMAAYLARRLPGLHGVERLARLMHQRTEGNPLFMVTLVESWLTQGILLEQDGASALPAGVEALQAMVPDSLRQMIDMQLDWLSAEEQRVLEAASVAGVEFSAAAVAAGLAQEVERVDDWCISLARRGQFLEARGEQTWPDGMVAGGYRFVHALYQHALYTRVSAAQRVRFHQRIGTRLETGHGAQAGDMAAELAIHFERGRDAQRAIQYLRHAGERSMERSAYVEAVAHVTRGPEVLQTLPDTVERTQQELVLQLTLGRALTIAKGYAAPETGKVFTRAMELCQQVGETQQLFSVLNGLYDFYLNQGQYRMAYTQAEQIIHLAQRQHNPVFLRTGHYRMGQSLFWLGELSAARTHLEQTMALDDPRQHPTTLSMGGMRPINFTRNLAASALWLLGYPEQAIQRSQEALTLAKEWNRLVDVASALNWAAWLHQYRREGPRAQEQAEASITLAIEHGFAVRQALGTIMLGGALAMQGQGEAGIAHLRQGLAAWRAVGSEVGWTNYLTFLAEAYGRVGQAAAGLHVLTEALAFAHTTGERMWEAELYRLKGELLLQSQSQGPESEVLTSDTRLQTQDAEAEACFHQALAMARRQQARALELRAAMSLSRLWMPKGKHAAIRELLVPIYNWFTEGFDTADLQEARALLEALS